MRPLIRDLVDGGAVPRLRAPWKKGSEPDATDVMVSFTEFTFDRYRDLPRIFVASIRLRHGWRHRAGAVGISSYARLASRRIGTVSVWSERAALDRFVASAYHVRIMRRYRSRGSIRALTWNASELDLNEAYHEADKQLSRRPGSPNSQRDAG